MLFLKEGGSGASELCDCFCQRHETGCVLLSRRNRNALKFESPGWTEFATDGATVALHASEVSVLEKDNPARVPAGRSRPGLSVANLDEFHKKMVEKNVPCVQPPKEVFGARIAQYVDPDGLALSVSEERKSS